MRRKRDGAMRRITSSGNEAGRRAPVAGLWPVLGALIAGGCVAPPVDVSERELSRMALLVVDDDGGWDVELRDLDGTLLQRIEANLEDPRGISHHPGGFFLIGTALDQLSRLDMNGATTPFHDEPVTTDIHRTWVGEDGVATLSGEFDAIQLDPEGEVIDLVGIPGDQCWMDAAPGPSEGQAALLDVFGPTVVAWDLDEGSFEPIATLDWPGNVFVDSLGGDDSGNYYLGSSEQPNIWMLDEEDEFVLLTDLSSLDFAVRGVGALEVPNTDRVLALVRGDQSSAVVDVGRDGQVTEVVRGANARTGGLWRDITLW